MQPLHPLIERHLRAVAQRWTTLRVAEAAAIWLTGAVIGQSLLLASVYLGYLVTYQEAAVAEVIFLLSSVLGLIISLTLAVRGKRERIWLARAVEASSPTLNDRLNTLAWLHQRDALPTGAPPSADPPRHRYFEQIQTQTRRLLPVTDLPFPFSRKRLARRWLFALVLLVLAIGWSVALHPWTKLVMAREQPGPKPVAAGAAPFALPGPPDKPLWGEVKITEPGKDLKVTKVDVVALQIEAVSNQTLKSVHWHVIAPGEKETVHDLPPPQEANYGVFRPILYVDELELKDWDTVAYFARAETTTGQTYASEMYWLEVRPFREDFQKQKEDGGDGEGQEALDELNALINQQKKILRNTFRFTEAEAQHTRPDKDQDLGKLSTAEEKLGTAAHQLYAKVAGTLENKSVGPILEGLHGAETEAGQAVEALKTDAGKALDPEQQALALLLSTRKALQRYITEHPESAKAEDEATRQLEKDQRQSVASFRQQEQAVLDGLEDIANRESELSHQAASAPTPEMAAEQQKLQELLKKMQQDAPEMFKGAEKQAAAAQQAMQQAQEDLNDKLPTASRKDLRQATAATKKLNEAVAQNVDQQQLAHLYGLQKELEGQMQDLKQMAQGEQPGTPPGGQKPTPGYEPGAKPDQEGKTPSPGEQPPGEKPGQGEPATAWMKPEAQGQEGENTGSAEQGPGKKPGDKPGQGEGSSPGAMTPGASGSPSSQPGSKPGNSSSPSPKPGSKPSSESGSQPGAKPGGSGSQAGAKPGGKPGAKGEPANSPERAEAGELTQANAETLKQIGAVAAKLGETGEVSPELAAKLNDPTLQQALAQQQRALSDARNPAARQQAAGNLEQGLQPIRDALKKALPSPGQTAGEGKSGDSKESQGQQGQEGKDGQGQQGQAGQPGQGGNASEGSAAAQEALGAAVRQMEGMTQQNGRGGGGNAASTAMQESQRKDILANLQQGLNDGYPDTPARAELLARAEEALKDPKKGDNTPVDPEKLRRLLNEVEAFRREMSRTATPEEAAQQSFYDPEKLPAAYRERIQLYFQKLSEP